VTFFIVGASPAMKKARGHNEYQVVDLYPTKREQQFPVRMRIIAKLRIADFGLRNSKFAFRISH
jgi:hypothetical protein